MSRRRVLELTGLPGSGKTTLCQALVAQVPGFEESRVGRWRRAAGVRALSRLFLPLTVIRFRRAAALVLAGRRARAGAHAGTGRLLRRSLGFGGAISDEWSRRVYRLLGSLARVHAEQALARLEAMVRRKHLLFDEGLVQRGTGFWLLADAGARQQAWRAALSRLPSAVGIVLLDVEPEQARRRALSRNVELPWTFAVAGESDGSTAREELFNQVAGLLRRSAMESQGTEWTEVRGKADTRQLLAGFLEALDQDADRRGTLVVARPRDRSQ